jgi:glycosyltransferase involved in cell wall biosynthesis
MIPQFGVDPSVFTPKPLERRTEGVFIIGYAGRLVSEKGIDLLLHAAARLPGAWRVHIAGDGPAHTALADLAAQLGLADRVVFEGQLPSAQMVSFYHRLDALVLPSRTRPNWKEQFGRLLIEAMACRVPVVGACSGAIPGVIGEGGLIFPEDDVAALHDHLLALMEDEALRQQLGEAGRARVIEHFTQARVAAQTVDVYRAMVEQR